MYTTCACSSLLQRVIEDIGNGVLCTPAFHARVHSTPPLLHAFRRSFYDNGVLCTRTFYARVQSASPFLHEVFKSCYVKLRFRRVDRNCKVPQRDVK